MDVGNVKKCTCLTMCLNIDILLWGDKSSSIMRNYTVVKQFRVIRETWLVFLIVKPLLLCSPVSGLLTLGAWFSCCIKIPIFLAQRLLAIPKSVLCSLMSCL